ncbi:uncharacterized protein LOC128227292 [Mya arenaria]|uniref:uncharacterized protein LOC128227292 n=1 Tax=Mya arenaria TaxID=6604 RepID=UPI0022E514D0|nr:uncharacterized protein LOC128227292 [Mya arenaria]XP_052793654.1 uncharacterized protein LOC128227292 [Mya arenaria]
MYTSVYLGFVTFVILMRCNGQFFPTLKPSPRAGVIAGNDLQLICSYDGIENVTICTWKIDGGSVGILRLLDTGCIVYQSLANTTLYNATCLGNNMFSVVLKHVKKEYHGMRWDCEMRIGGSYYKSNTSEIYVAVPVASVTFEPPSSQHITLNENSTYKAQCRTTPARPLAVISWRNDSKTHDLLDDDKDVIAEVTHTTEKNGTIVTTISTVKGRVGIFDNGISLYCTASNVGGIHVISSQRIYIGVEYSPRPILPLSTTVNYVVGRTQRALLHLGVLANPTPTFHWYKKNQCDHGWRSIESMDGVQITATRGLNTSLVIPYVSLKDYGMYKVEAGNGISEPYIQLFTVIKPVTDKPDTPLKFLCLNDSVTSNSAILFWQSGDDGGERPTYLLELLTADITTSILYTPEDVDDQYMFYTLSELNSDTSYAVKLIATNSAGSSNPLSVWFTTRSSEEKPVSTALTVTSSVLGSAVFILIVVLLLLCFRKRANVLTSKGTEDMKLDPLQTQREASYTDLTRPSPDQDNQYDTINAASTM